MKKYLLAILIFLPRLFYSQVNLIPNPGFEEYNYCPSTFSAFSWYSETSAKYWMNGSASTSDYFNACDGDSATVGVPQNTFSIWQPAHGGNGYVGFYSCMWDWGSWLYREYVQVEMTDALVAGTCYYVEFYAAPANPPEYYATGFATSDAIGAHFSEIKIGNPMISDYLPLTPQIDNNATGNYIDPPGGWTKVSGIFEAEGDEKWVCFGNFYHDDFVEVVAFTGGVLTDQPFVYFFLDDVLVTPVDSFLEANMIDTIVCEPYELSAPGGASSYLWNTGDTTQTITITASGIYSISFETDCGIYNYDAHILYAEDTLNSTSTSVELCTSELPHTIEGFPAYNSYSWSTGDTTSSISINEEGIYVLTGTGDCAIFVDTFIVTITDPVGEIPELGNDTLICEENWEMNLITPAGFQSYSWSTGDSVQNITVNTGGIYYVTVESACELFSDTITIEEDPFLNSTIELGDDFELCPPIGIDQFIADAGADLPNYTWSTGETTQSITITQAGTYWVRSELLCSTPADTIVITACNDIAVPNAFSPNGDGVNDELVVFILDPSRIISFNIYNRWGEIVYAGNASNYRWDGKLNGLQQPVDDYVYILRYDDEGVEKMMQGNILLIR